MELQNEQKQHKNGPCLVLLLSCVTAHWCKVSVICFELKARSLCFSRRVWSTSCLRRTLLFWLIWRHLELCTRCRTVSGSDAALLAVYQSPAYRGQDTMTSTADYWFLSKIQEKLWSIFIISNSSFLCEYLLNCHLFLWCAAVFSASLLQSSVSHDLQKSF